MLSEAPRFLSLQLSDSFPFDRDPRHGGESGCEVNVSRMSWSHDPHVQALRLKYNAALAAHQACASALTEARMGDGVPSPEAVEREAGARGELMRAREELFGAMAALVTGQHPALTLDPGGATQS